MSHRRVADNGPLPPSRAPARFTRSGWALALALALVLAACAAMPYRTSPDDAAAKSFAVASGTAAIYVYWPRGRAWIADQPGIPVAIDGRAVGRVYGGTYLVHTLSPGEHDVWVGWDGSTRRTVSDPIRSRLVHLPVRTAEGQTVFVRLDLAQDAHRLADPAAARTELNACCIRIEPDPSATALFR